MNPETVLDASALLAYLNCEPGHEEVERCLALKTASISAVNYCEVMTTISRQKKISLGQLFPLFRATDMKIVPFDDLQAKLAAAIHANTDKKGLSLGDRACLALGLMNAAEVVTADKSWKQLDIDIHIRLIR